jgi:hypothetical protein
VSLIEEIDPEVEEILVALQRHGDLTQEQLPEATGLAPARIAGAVKAGIAGKVIVRNAQGLIGLLEAGREAPDEPAVGPSTPPRAAPSGSLTVADMIQGLAVVEGLVFKAEVELVAAGDGTVSLHRVIRVTGVSLDGT